MGNWSLRHMLRQLRSVRRPGRPAAPLAVVRLEDRTLPSTLAPLTLFNPTLPQSDATGGVTDAQVSADGRFLVFTSTAPNLVPGQTDTAVASNVFLRDRLTGTTTLVSHVPDAPSTGADGDSSNPRVSADGHYVVYESTAADLVLGQAGPRGQSNVFLYDTTLDTTTLISHRAGAPATAADGPSLTEDTTGFGFAANADRYFLFSSNANDLVAGEGGPNDLNLFLYDTAAGRTTLVSHNASSTLVGANDDTERADLTPDGSTVVFQSFATDVVPGQTTAHPDNIFLWRSASNASQLLTGAFNVSSNSSTDAAGFSFAPTVSADGQVVAYASYARDLVAGQTTVGGENVFVYDAAGGTTTLVSGSGGSASLTGDDLSGEPQVSSDGSTVAFVSLADDLTPGEGANPFGDGTGNVFLYDTASATLTLASHVAGSPTAAAYGVFLLDVLAYGDLSVSADGGQVSYESRAPDLVAGQPGPFGISAFNVFLYDAGSGQNALVSQANDPANPPSAGDQASVFSRVSADGSTVAFLSGADNLDPAFHVVASDLNLFSYDVTAAPGTRPGPDLESTSAFQAQATSLVFGTSADGRFVVFTSNDPHVVPGQVTNNLGQNVFLLDQNTGTITLVSHLPGRPTATADLFSYSPVISGDGSSVAFASYADDLVAGETGVGTNFTSQVYLFNRLTGVVSLVSHDLGSPAAVGLGPAYAPAVSADGSTVAYEGFAPDLVPGFQEPLAATLVDNVYLYDTATGTNTLVSHAAGTTQTGGDSASFNPDLSADGRFVAYESSATTLVAGGVIAPTTNVYLFDRTTGTSTLVSHAAGSPTTSPTSASGAPRISRDGGTVAFVSYAADLVPGQQPSSFTNVFVYDNRALVGGSPNPAYRTVELVSGVNGSATLPAGGFSDSPALTDDGSLVAFRSDAPDVVAGQVNTPGATSNVFLFDRQTATVTLVSHAAGAPATTAAGDSTAPNLDGAGDLVVYLSTATNLVPGQQGGGVNNVFVHAVDLGANALASGQGGSTTVPSPTPTFQALLSEDPVVTFNGAGGLVPGAGGTSVAYVNSLVALTLAPNAVPAGGPPGSVVGALGVETVFAGQFLPPAYRLPAAEANNGLFAVAGTGGQAALVTQFQASSTAQGSYLIRVHVNIGFGDYAAFLQVFGAAPGTAPGPTVGGGGILSELVLVRAGRKKKARLMVEVLDAATGALKAEFVSPFQRPRYAAIQVSVRGSQVIVTARKGRARLSRTYSA